MHNMVPYSFYKEEYLGDSIQEWNWPKACFRAEEKLEALEHKYTLTPYGPDSRKMAVCAIAELTNHFRRDWYITKERLGEMNVEYEPDSDKKLQRRILQSIEGYFQRFRGVG